MILRALCILFFGMLIGMAAMWFLFRDSSAQINSHHKPSCNNWHDNNHRWQTAQNLRALRPKVEKSNKPKDSYFFSTPNADYSSDSDHFQKIDEIIRNGAFRSHLSDFEVYCSTSSRENVVTYLLACVDGGDEDVLLRMNAAALHNPTESIRDQALITLISITGINFDDDETAAKWVDANLNLSTP